jgi:hypothetical protein
VPVDRIDLTVNLLWNSARLEDGFVAVGRSSARFSGTVEDSRIPKPS